MFVAGARTRYSDAERGHWSYSSDLGRRVDVVSIRVILAGLIGIGLALVALTIGPSLAGADPTCYTGCSTTVPPAVLATQTAQQPQVLASTATSNGLAFTGADEAGLLAFAAVALVGGGVLVGVSRRRRASS